MLKARDIADEVGVSVSTIGRALADDPRISEETKAKVRRVAERLGYVGNNAAQMMRGRSSNLIGLMIPDVANYFYAAIAQAMSDGVNRGGYRLVLSLTRDDPELELRNIRELAHARAAGIILVPTATPRRESRNLLSAVPHVQFLRQTAALDSSWFGIDDENAIRRATVHLLELGHRRIAYIGGLAALSTGVSRLRGYRSALREAGIAANPELERLGPPTAPYGEAACRDLLALPQPPTALLTGSVHITEGVIAELERSKVEVPRTLSMIGFGGAAWFSWWRGGLTVVDPPVVDLTTNCVLWFLNHLPAQSRLLPASYHSVATSGLVVRMSTAAPSSAAPPPRRVQRRKTGPT